MVIRIDKPMSRELLNQIRWLITGELASEFRHDKYIVVSTYNPSDRLRLTARILNALRSYGINESNRTKLNKGEWKKEQLKLKMLGVM